MVISDFNIVCLNQHVAQTINYKDIGTDIVSNGYGKHWKVLKKSCGIWYQFYPNERNITKQYNDEFFDLSIVDNIYYLVLLDNHGKDVKDIVETYLSFSPINEIIVLFRLDEYMESDKITKLSVVDFIENLNNGSLQFNKIYKVNG